jgi:hypothetical protein
MAKLRLILINNSGTPGNIVIYQRSQQRNEKEALLPLAWQSHHAFPGTMVQVDWDDREWAYSWAAVAQIQPGVVFTPAQTTPASPNEGNQIEFLAASEGTFEFANQKNGAVPGYFAILQAASIPLNSVTVGLGMEGKTAFASVARPNSRILFGSQVSYWVTFGDIAEGEFLFDLATLPSARVDFPPGAHTLMARLNPDFSWTIEEAALAGTEADTDTEAGTESSSS